MDQASLKKLYAWFDQFIDLPADKEALALKTLREQNEPLVLHLECLLASARKNTNTSAAFGISDILDAAEQSNLTDDLTSNIDQLSKELHCDPVHHVYRVGDFLLKRCLSVSKLGITYYAHDAVLDRDVALLLAMPNWRSSPVLRNRLVESARVVAKLFHPNVASILGTLDIQSQFLILRQWIPGVNLQDALLNGGPLTLDQSLQTAFGICAGLQALHSENVLHGDLKPANIILRQDSKQPVITDFGTSLWLGDPQNPDWKGGTLGYIAPEILRGQPATKSADLFSLGVVLHQLQHPNSLPQIATSAASPSPQRQFDSLIESLTSDSPERRPTSIEEVLTQLQSIANEHAAKGQTASGAAALDPIASTTPEALSRRTWLLNALELPLLAGTSTSLAFLATRSLFNEQSIPSPYVPGIETKHKLSFLWQANAEGSGATGSEQAETQTHRIPPFEPNDLESYGVAPTVTDRWIHLESSWEDLPSFEVKANLVMVVVRYDAPPRSAKIQIAYRYAKDTRWTNILKTTNTFGGPYFKHYHLSLANNSYRPNQSLQFRVSMFQQSLGNRVAGKPSNNDSRTGPIPLCVNLRQKDTDDELVRLLLWDRLMYKPDRSDKVEV